MKRPEISTDIGATGAYVALSVADTYLAGQASDRRRRLRVAIKPLLMPSLMIAFSAGTGPQAGSGSRSRRALRRGTLVAQAFSCGGDVALLSRRESAFLAGVGSFFAAHVSYAATFAAHGRPIRDQATRNRTVATLALLGPLAPAVGWAAGRRSPTLRGPVTAYAAMITAMMTSSIRLDGDLPPPARRAIGVGTSLFLLSDSVIAARRFVLPSPTPHSDAVVMATYTAGQGLIALGLAQAARAPRPAAPAPPVRVEETDG